MIEKMIKNKKVEKIKDQKVDLRNLKTQIEFSNDIIATKQQQIAEMSDVVRKNKAIIVESKTQLNHNHKEIKEKNKALKELQRETVRQQNNLTDLIDQIEAKSASLNELTQKLDQKQRIYGEVTGTVRIKKIEHEQTKFELDQLKEQSQKINEQIKATNDQIQNLENEKAQILAMIEDLGLKNNQDQVLATSALERKQILRSNVDQLKAKERELEERLSFQINSIAQDNEELKNDRAIFEKLKLKLAQLENKIAEFRSEENLLTSQRDEFLAVKKKLENDHQELEAIVAKSSNNLKNLREEVKELKATKQDIEKRLSALNKTQDEINAEESDLNDVLSSVAREVGLKEQELAEIESQGIEVKSHNESLLGEIKESEAQLADLNHLYHQLKTEIELENQKIVSAQAKKSQLETQITQLNNQYQSAQAEIEGIALQSEQFAQKIEDLERNKELLVESITAQESIKYEQLDRLKSLQNAYTKKENEIEEKNNHLNRLHAESEDAGEKLVQLKRQIEKKTEVIEYLNNKIKEAERDIRDLDRKYLQEEKKVEQLEAKLEELQGKNLTLQKEINQKEESYHKISCEHQEQTKKVEQLMDEKNKLLNTKNKLDQEIKACRDEIVAINKQLQSGKNQWQQENDAILSFESQLVTSRKHLSEHKEKLEAQNEKLHFILEKRKTVESSLISIQNQFQKEHQLYTQSKKRLESEKIFLQNAIKNFKNYREQKIVLEEQIVESKALASSLREKVEKLTNANNSILQDIATKQGEYKAYEAVVSATGEDLEKLEQKEHFLKEKVDKIDASIGQLIQKIEFNKEQVIKKEEAIVELKTNASQYKDKIQNLSHERYQLEDEEVKVQSELSLLEKSLNEIKRVCDEKRTQVDSLKKSVQEKMSKISKSKFKIPTIEAAIEKLTDQHVFLMRNEKILAEFEKRNLAMEEQINNCRENSEKVFLKLNDLFYKVEILEVLQNKMDLNPTENESQYLREVENLFTAMNDDSIIQVKKDVSQLATNFESFCREFRLKLNIIGDEIFPVEVEKGNLVDEIVAHFDANEQRWQECFDKYHYMFSHAVNYLENCSNEALVYENLFVEGMGKLAEDVDIELELSENVESMMTIKTYRIIKNAIKSYCHELSLRLNQTSFDKLRIQVVKLTNFNDDHFIFRVENVSGDKGTLKNAVDKATEALKGKLQTQIKVGSKLTENKSGVTQKLDIILKYDVVSTTAVPSARKKRTHIVKSRTNQSFTAKALR